MSNNESTKTKTPSTQTNQLHTLSQEISKAIRQVRQTTPLVPSITNTVTINFVANAQLAIGGSAAMCYMPADSQQLAHMGQAFYINLGTIIPIYEETIPQIIQYLHDHHKPWVLDPVGTGIGDLRTSLIKQMKDYPPTIIRGNASEIIAVANLWNLPIDNKTSSQSQGVRGVDSTDSSLTATPYAIALAKHIQGAVAISGQTDIITDGQTTIQCTGGSPLFTKVTGSGCSLGGVIAVYAAVTNPLLAALTGTTLYNYAGQEAHQRAKGPGSFQPLFLDALYTADANTLAKYCLEHSTISTAR